MCRKLAAKAILRPQFREVGHGPVFILGAPTALVNVNVCSVYLLCMWLHLSLGPVQFQPNPNRICLSLIDRQATMEVLVLKVRSCRNPVKAQNTWNCKSVADSISNCVWMVKWRRHDKCWRTIQGHFSYFSKHTAKTSACNHHLWLHGICLLARLHIQAWTSLWNRQQCSCVSCAMPEIPREKFHFLPGAQKSTRHFPGVVFFY